jgi:hypothetical protein
MSPWRLDMRVPPDWRNKRAQPDPLALSGALAVARRARASRPKMCAHHGRAHRAGAREARVPSASPP